MYCRMASAWGLLGASAGTGEFHQESGVNARSGCPPTTAAACQADAVGDGLALRTGSAVQAAVATRAIPKARGTSALRERRAENRDRTGHSSSGRVTER